MTSARRPLIDRADVVTAVTLMAALAGAALVPAARWPALARAYGAATTRSAKWRRRAAGVAQLVGRHRANIAVADWPRTYAANIFLNRLMLMRWHLWPGWRPRVAVEGAAHVAAALAAGQGAILWVMPLVFSDLVTKMALSEAGLEVHHLSRFSHPFSETAFGVRVLNRLQQRVEDRFLAGRVAMPTEETLPALRRLTRHLRRGDLVSITVGTRGRNALRRPFLDRSMTLASGAPDLARRTGAPLLPVFTTRRDDGEFAVRIEAPLWPDGAAPAEDELNRLADAWCVLFERPGLAHLDQMRWT